MEGEALEDGDMQEEDESKEGHFMYQSFSTTVFCVIGLTGKELDSEEDDEDDAGQEYLRQLAKTVRKRK